MENVAALETLHRGQYLKAIIKELKDIGKYNVHYQRINTCGQGIPHNRERIYICGILQWVDKVTFEWPKAIPDEPLDTFLDTRDLDTMCVGMPPESATGARQNVAGFLRALTTKGLNPFQDTYVIDCDSSPERTKCWSGRVPCLTCKGRGHWVSNQGRRLRKAEMMRLQGMIPSEFNMVTSEAQLGK